tara:strand:+ start:1260 stop:2999 length:1740 start_codon:yes stop_codon:yes gene_type:complete
MKYNFNLIDNNYNDIDSILKEWSKDNNYMLDYYTFGDEFINISDIDEIDFTDKFTDFSILFNNIESDVILITDGVINSGSIKIPKIDYKINTIGIGNENNIYNDISIELKNHKILNDSLEIDLLISSNINEDLLNYNIYIENSKLDNKITIDTFDCYKNIGQILKRIKVSSEIISNYNFLSVDSYPRELNYDNNSTLLNIENNKKFSKKILFITGSISSNTKFIKNNILIDTSNYEVDHYFKLNNDLWNKNLADIDYSDYNILVFDDFPSSNIDNKYINDIMKNKFDNILYFMGPSNMIYNNQILNQFNCTSIDNLNKNINDYQEIFFNNKDYIIPLILNNQPLDCDNSIINSSFGSTIIAKKNNISLFLISDLQDLFYYNDYKNDNFNDFIKHYTDNIIYDNQYLNIYTNQNTFFVDDTIEVFFETNNTISNSDKYILILDKNKEIVEKLFNNINLDDNLFLFQFILNDSGKYYVQGNVDNMNNNFNSSLIPIEVVNNNLELSEIYLNTNLLKLISRKSNGIYNKYDKLDVFLNNINFKEENITNNSIKQMISYWYILMILIFLLTIEWYYRNKYGLI